MKSESANAHGHRVQGRHTVNLSWNGATPANIDILREAVVITTVPNNGAYTDSIGVRRGNARYTYKVCEAATQNCSNEVTVRFGGPPLYGFKARKLRPPMRKRCDWVSRTYHPLFKSRHVSRCGGSLF